LNPAFKKMKSKLLSEFSVIELNIEVKKRKQLFIVMSIIVGVILVSNIILIFQDHKKYPTFFPALVFLILLTKVFTNYNDSKKELESRL